LDNGSVALARVGFTGDAIRWAKKGGLAVLGQGLFSGAFFIHLGFRASRAKIDFP